MPWKDPTKKKKYQQDWYQQNKERTKAARSAWGKANRVKTKGYVAAWERRHPREAMVQKSKSSAKPRGLDHSITVADLIWPTHCPVLGIELCYDRDKKTPRRDCYPTLDRHDNALGYVPGNVFVISWRANRIKWMATPDELAAVARYAAGELPPR